MDYPFETFDVEQIIKEKRIGEGNFSKVFKIREKSSGKIFAAKILKDPYEDENSKEYIKLKDEIEIISKLKHPAIVRFVGFSPINFKRKKNPIILTEYVPNGSLQNILEDEQEGNCDEDWDDTKKLIVIYGIASAMMYLHDNGIIHRDLKPDNILMDQDLYPKIADFGLSKNTLKKKESTVAIKGTPKYIAPEIYNTYTYTPKCDVYSYAIIVFEILQGLEIINGIELSKRLYKQKRPKINDTVSSSYRQLIEQCWSQDPEKRPNFSEIVDRLENDKEFIKETIDEDEYLRYQDYIKNATIREILQNNDTTISISKYTNQGKLLIKKSALKLSKVEEITDDELYLQAIQFYNGINGFTDKEKAASLFKESADRGNSQSMTKYGEMLFNGDGILPNKPAAIDYFKKAIEKGNSTAMVLYADSLLKGDGVEMNKEEAVNYYELAAENENLDGMKKYADQLFNGDGIETSKFRAIQYYIKAADEGHKESIITLFNIINNENININDSNKYIKKAADLGEIEAMNKYADILLNDDENAQPLEAVNYYKRAINKGSSYAMYKYAQILYNGSNGIEKDTKKAFDYYQMAIRKGQIDAMFDYAKITYNNNDIIDNKIESAHYFEKAANKGHIKAMIFYAKMLNEGDGIDQDQKKANSYYKMAADKGDVDSMFILAKNLKNGIGIDEKKKDNESVKKKAAEYFEKAANKGHSDSMFEAGQLFDHDDYTFCDYEKAAKFYKMAIEKSDTTKYHAMNNLALLYENGNGVPQNLKEAVNYFKLATDHNDPDATNNYARLLFYGKGVDEDKMKSAHYYKIAADLGNSSAMNNYANMLYNGQGAEADKKESFNYYYKSAKKGNKYACYNYALLLEKGEIQGDININMNLAKIFLKEASNKNHTYAAYHYAVLLDNEMNDLADKKLVDYDDPNDPYNLKKIERVQYFKIAADNGHVESMFQYGRLKYFGIGTDIDQVEGYLYLQKAYKNGSEKAESLLQSIECAKACSIC